MFSSAAVFSDTGSNQPSTSETERVKRLIKLEQEKCLNENLDKSYQDIKNTANIELMERG